MSAKASKLKQIRQPITGFDVQDFCVTGSLHIKNNMPCQDAAYAYMEDNYCLAVIADGHGSPQYFRSDRGSRFAVETFMNCVKQALTNTQFYYHDDKHPKDNTSINLVDMLANAKTSEKKRDQAIKTFCQSILANWLNAVNSDMQKSPFTKDELLKIPEKYRKQHQDTDQKYISAYGSTLVAALLVADFCLLIQIGDGACVVFDDDYPNISSKVTAHHRYIHDKLVSYEPIPLDDLCFLNTTTSLCDAKANEEFHFCFLKKLPVAVFVTSDGIETCFEHENMHKFFHRVLSDFSASHLDQAKAELSEFLPRLSANGSGDDLSLAMIYNASRFKELTQDQPNNQ